MPCDCCPAYEEAFDTLYEILGCSAPFGEDGRAWQIHHVVEAARVTKKQLASTTPDTEQAAQAAEYRRICEWLKIQKLVMNETAGIFAQKQFDGEFIETLIHPKKGA